MTLLEQLEDKLNGNSNQEVELILIEVLKPTKVKSESDFNQINRIIYR